jgi:hypothetical protein
LEPGGESVPAAVGAKSRDARVAEKCVESEATAVVPSPHSAGGGDSLSQVRKPLIGRRDCVMGKLAYISAVRASKLCGVRMGE